MCFDRPGGIFIRRPELMSEEDRILLQAVARVVLADSAGPLVDQIERRGSREIMMPALVPTRSRKTDISSNDGVTHRDLIYANGIGGFTPDGREYVISITPSQRTPAPWANVLANSQFGTVVTESGCGYTWFEKRARVSIDSLVQRSGDRSQRRISLSARRRQ